MCAALAGAPGVRGGGGGGHAPVRVDGHRERGERSTINGRARIGGPSTGLFRSRRRRWEVDGVQGGSSPSPVPLHIS